MLLGQKIGGLHQGGNYRLFFVLAFGRPSILNLKAHPARMFAIERFNQRVFEGILRCKNHHHAGPGNRLENEPMPPQHRQQSQEARCKASRFEELLHRLALSGSGRIGVFQPRTDRTKPGHRIITIRTAFVYIGTKAQKVNSNRIISIDLLYLATDTVVSDRHRIIPAKNSEGSGARCCPGSAPHPGRYCQWPGCQYQPCGPWTQWAWIHTACGCGAKAQCPAAQTQPLPYQTHWPFTHT